MKCERCDSVEFLVPIRGAAKVTLEGRRKGTTITDVALAFPPTLDIKREVYVTCVGCGQPYFLTLDTQADLALFMDDHKQKMG